MISLNINTNQKFNEIRLVELLFYLFPLSFILGNLIISINLLLLLIFSFLLIKKERMTFRFKKAYWILIIFFIYLFLSTTIQYKIPGLLHDKIANWSLESNPIFKSFILVRFLILIFVIDILLFNKIINIKKLFFVSLLCTSFVSFDVILQYVSGTDLFGYKSLGRWNSGPFGDEIIAGSYLAKFSFFSFFFIYENFKNKKFNTSLLTFVIAFHLIAILFAGNRMPLILALFGCVLIFFICKKLRLVISLALIIFTSVFFLQITNDKNLKKSYLIFLSEINIAKIIDSNKEKNLEKKEEKVTELTEESRSKYFLQYTGYGRIYQTSIDLWKKQPLFGFGLKSFRIKCWEVLEEDMSTLFDQDPKIQACSNHSHNYYLELLSEAGIIGLALIVIFFLILLKESFYHLKKHDEKINLLIPIIILIFLEIWPIRSAGSFFTTANATFFWLNVSMLMAARKSI